MSRKRVIYQSEALFTGPMGADATTTGNNKQINRVQSINYNFEITRQDINQFGNLAAIDRIILEQPTVSLDFTYYANSGENENNIGLAVGTGDANTPALSHILTGKANTDPKNYYILTSPEGTDANVVGWTTSSGKTIGIGNASLTSYQIEAAVGDIPTVTVNAEALNMNFVNGTTGTPNPAVDPVNGTPVVHGFKLPTPVSGDGFSALRPGDITIDINDGALGLSESDLKIQSASVSVEIARDPIQKLGSKFAFTREITFPITATMSVEAIVGDTAAGTLANVLTNDADYELVLSLKKPDGTGEKALKYTLKKAKLDSQDFSSSIGDNKSVSLQFSTQIGGPNETSVGLFIDGPHA
ncbi:MAG: hypothetical protein EBU90_08235 [Proteobacteria bacterium]|nr:hypothetical protein [Pseudomonadota bacterium]